MKAKQAHSFELAEKVGEIHLIEGKPFILYSVDKYPTFTRTTFRDYVKSFLENQMLLFPGSVSWVRAKDLFKDVFLLDVRIEKHKSGLVHIYQGNEEKKE